MKITEFEIGLLFQTCTGQIWRCTDVGSRTILAIEIEPDRDTHWYQGPPYAVEEKVFDEIEIERCYRNHEEAVRQTLRDNSHPGYPMEVVRKMMNYKTKSLSPDPSTKYPHNRLLKIDRVNEQGDIFHPYGAEQSGQDWRILVYLPYTEKFSDIAETDFIRLRATTSEDYRRRKADS